MPVNATKKVIVQGLRIALFVVLIVTALYVSLGRIAASALGSVQDDIAALLSNSTGVAMSVGQLQGSWAYLNPKIKVSKFVVGESSSPAVLLEEITFQFSTFHSLLERSPVFTEISVDGLSMTLEEQPGGGWRVRGLPAGDGNFNTQLLFDSAAHIEELTLGDLNVHLEGLQSKYQIRSESSNPLQIVKNGDESAVSFPLVIEKISEVAATEPNRIQVVGAYAGDFRDIQSFELNLHIQIENIELADFLPTVTFREFQLVSADVGGQIWLDYKGSIFDVIAELRSSKVKLSSAGKDVNFLNETSLNLRLQGSADDQKYQIRLPRVAARIAGEMFELTDVDLLVERRGKGYVVAGGVPAIEITKLLDSVSSIDAETNFLSARARQALAEMNPGGSLEAIAFYLDSSLDQPEMKLVSQIRDLRMDAYLGAPGISRLDGFVSLRPTQGYIDIDNRSYSMQFASMFDLAWPFDSARGRLNYFYREGVLQFSSGLLELIKGDLSAYGKVHISLPPVRAEQTWGLVIGINDGDIVDAYRYLPKTLSTEFLSWIENAVVEGTVKESALLFHGSLFRGAPKIRKIYELYLDVGDATLDYHEDWPPVSALNAMVYINNNGVLSEGATGTMLESNVREAIVSVPMPSTGQIDNISITGSFRGPLSDGVRIFNETPLAEMTGHMADLWSGSGDLGGIIQLDVPVGPRSGEDTLANVSVLLSGNDLTMPQFDLTAFDLEGEINYATTSGLTAQKFTGTLFEQPILGSIHSTQVDDSGEVTVAITGRVDVQDLHRWSDQVLLTAAIGNLTYEAEVHVPFGGSGDRSYVEATSSLSGIIIDMPPPIGKSDINAEVDSFYRQTIMDNGFRLEFSMKDKLQGSLQIEEEVVVGGNLYFGQGGLGAVSYDDVNVTGRLDRASYEEWDNFFENMDRSSDISLESEMSATLDSINLTVGLLDIYSFQMSETRLNIERVDSGWKTEIENRNVVGSVISPDDDQLPLSVNLEHMKFFEEDSSGDVDPFGDVLPQEMLAIDFSTRELEIEGEDYGSWSFNFRPNPEGGTFENLIASVKGMNIEEPSSAVWKTIDGVHSSTFSGLVTTQDLGSMLEQWGYASSIEGDDFKFLTKLSWAGSPAMVDMDYVEGSLQIEGKKGRFVQAETGTATLKLLGIFDFNKLGRRLRFDFSDVVDEGYSFDKISGQVSLNHAEMEVTEPVVIAAAGSQFKIGGKANLATEELDGDMIVTLLVGKNLPWYAAYSAIVTGPLIGAGVLLAQKIFENQINQMASSKYKVTGTIEEPDIVFVSFFDDSVRETVESEEVADEKDSTELDEI
jgi:uncharacterized protein (TIGR02099 family)